MIKVVVVGTGWWGMELAGACRDVPGDVEILGCCSLSETERQKFQAEFGGRIFEALEDVLSESDVDAVLLATPHSLHWQQVIAAAEAGKHVFCEKPLALNAETASKAIAACRDQGVVLAVGHNRRFSDAVREIKELIDSGDCGQIFHVEANYSGNAALHWPAEYWRAQRNENPGGAVGPMGLHMIDTLSWICGPVVRLTAKCKRQIATNDIDDTTVVMFELESGMTGSLGCLFAAPPSSYIRFYGTGAILEARGNFSSLSVKYGDGDKPDIEKEYAEDRTLQAEMKAFSEACNGGVDYPVRPEEALHNVAVMETIVKSSDAGGVWIDLAWQASSWAAAALISSSV